MALVQELPLLSAGRSVGRAEYEEVGLRVRFRCRVSGEKLCKLYLAQDAARFLLGTPAPAQGSLYLERTLSRGELERNGVWPPERIEVNGAAASPCVWQDVTPVQPQFTDPLLERVFRQGGWGWKRWAEGIVLRHGWRQNTSIPAMSIFCFLRLDEQHVYCWLDGEGRPCFPPDRNGWEGNLLDSFMEK